MCDKLLKIALYSAVFNLIFIPLNTVIAAFIGYIEILSFFFYGFFRAVYKKGAGTYMRIRSDILVFLGIIVASVILGLPYFDLNVLDTTIISILSFISFYWAASFQHEKCGIVFGDIAKINYVLTAVFFLYAFGNLPFTYKVMNAYGYRVFTMGMGNANSTSICVFFCIIIHYLDFISTKRTSKKLFLSCCVILLTYILFLLESRAVILCLLCLMLIFVTKWYQYFGRKTKTVMIYVFIGIPFFALAFQIFMGQRMQDMMLFGETIATGRLSIYLNFLSDLDRNPWQFFVGNLGKYPFKNLHNAPLTILASLGICGVFTYLRFWINKMLYLNKISVTGAQRFAIYAILILVLNSAAEVMTVTGAIPYGIFMLILIKIAQGDISDQQQLFSEKKA